MSALEHQALPVVLDCTIPIGPATTKAASTMAPSPSTWSTTPISGCTAHSLPAVRNITRITSLDAQVLLLQVEAPSSTWTGAPTSVCRIVLEQHPVEDWPRAGIPSTTPNPSAVVKR